MRGLRVGRGDRRRYRRWDSLFWSTLVMMLAACNLISTAGSPAAVAPTPDIPRVRILNPANNARLMRGETLILEVLAEDDGAGIHQVRLFVDDPLAEGEPYAAATAFNDIATAAFMAHLVWEGERSKSYLLTVVSYRADGTRSDGASISVHVADS
ncbi:MAG: Ig-like domain-containing protein [Chloroflexi bacterium]|nr:Ig-like domain-containing protein [Chloroflexota bacterium]